MSLEAESDNILSSLGSTTTTTLVQSLAKESADTASSSGLAFNSTGYQSDEFGVIDADVTHRILPNPIRGFDASLISTTDGRAFASTTILDLNPFDTSEITQLAYGSTFATVGNDNSTADLAFFRDGTQDATGALFHIDKTFFSQAGNTAIGFTHTVANDQYASTGISNHYLTVPDPHNVPMPSSSTSPITHSTNDVMGLGLSFGGTADAANNGVSVSRAFTAFGRYATNGYGHDATGVLSFQNTGSGVRISDDGTTLDSAAMVGLRSITYTYDPLMTAYDPLAGNRVYFGRINEIISQPKCFIKLIDDECPIGKRGAATSQVSYSIVRADDGKRTNYFADGLTFDAAFDSQFSLNVVLMSSAISGSVESRFDGKYVVLGAAAAKLTPNDATTLSLQFQAPRIATVSAGLALTDTPSCQSIKLCSSKFERSFTSSATITDGRLAANESTAPGALQAGKNATNVISSNQIVTKGLVSYHVCEGSSRHFGFAPSLTYSNAIPGTGSSFTPGSVVEQDLDIGNADSSATFGFHFSYSVVAVGHGVTLALPTHAFGFSIASASQMIWRKVADTGADSCLRKPPVQSDQS